MALPNGDQQCEILVDWLVAMPNQQSGSQITFVMFNWPFLAIPIQFWHNFILWWSVFLHISGCCICLLDIKTSVWSFWNKPYPAGTFQVPWCQLIYVNEFEITKEANLYNAGVREHNLPSCCIDWDIQLNICSLWISMGIVINYVNFILAYILWKLCHHNSSPLAFQGFLLQAVLENILQIQVCFVIVYDWGVHHILLRKRCTNLTSCFFGSRWCHSTEKKCHPPSSSPSFSC